MKVIELKETVTASNDRDAEVLREELTMRGVLLVNLMSAPGSGKTSLLTKTVQDLSELKIAVLEADLDARLNTTPAHSSG